MSVLPTALPSPQPVQAQTGNGLSAAAGAPEPDSGFANALQRARQGARLREAQADRKAEARKTEHAATDAHPAARAERQSAAAPKEAAEPAGAGTGAGTDAAAPAARTGAEPATAPGTTLPTWLESVLARGPAGGAEAGDGTAAAVADAGEGPAEALVGERGAARRFPAGPGETGKAQADDAETRSRTGADTDAAHAAFEAAFAEASGISPERAASSEHGPSPATGSETMQQSAALAAAATGAAGAAPGVAAGASPAVVERPLAAHVQSPEFAPALGAQLSILVKDGVSEARLHLNPAEMGPITVQIHIEGQTARVEMVAEHAATRQALEQSMPALAGALRESGLTLTGGGVFEQARDPRQGDPEGRPIRRGLGGTGTTSGEGVELSPDSGRPARLPAGVVDVYA